MAVMTVHNETTGEYTLINPHEIAWVNGYGRTFTVYMRTGDKICFNQSGSTVADFLEAWEIGLGKQP
jgi:hypothetical protein